MEFKLIYQGQLLGASRNDTRALHKHRVRKQFHTQIARLWKDHPVLAEMLITDSNFEVEQSREGSIVKEVTLRDRLARKFKRGNYRFVPIVTEDLLLACSLDILMLRRDRSGIIKGGGDIDNRLKTLFDALRIPDVTDGLDEHPSDGEDPFYCLLQDDALITQVTVTTAQLLTPTSIDEPQNHVVLVVGVRIMPIGVDMRNSGFAV